MMKKESNNSIRLVKGAGEILSTLPNYVKLAIFIVVWIIISALIPIKVLLARDYKTHDYLKSWIVKDGEDFTVEYTHSVQLTPVTETYIIDSDDIILIETGFKSYGAGLPATTPYKFEITSNGFRIYDINETIPCLVYRTGAERANHKLIYRNVDYEFLSFSEPREGVELKVVKMKIFSYIIREGLN